MAKDQSSNYLIFPPAETLEGIVNHFWISKRDSREDKNITYHATANTRTAVVFAFKKHPDERLKLLCSLVQGQTHRFSHYPAHGFDEVLGISLHPRAIPGIFNVPASDLNHQFIRLESLLDYEGRLLNETIANAISMEMRIKTLTCFFKRKLAKSSFDDELMAQALKQVRIQQGMVNIKELAREFHLSTKQFDRRFKAYAGFNPKLYARIVRFESVLENHGKYDSFTDMALMHGYYDQAHFISDFRQFSGFSPKQFFALSNH